VVLGGDPTPGVLDLGDQPQRPRRRALRPDPQRDPAARRELDRVPEEVDEHLAQLALVGDDVAWELGGEIDRQLQVLRLCANAEHPRDVAEQGAEVEGGSASTSRGRPRSAPCRGCR